MSEREPQLNISEADIRAVYREGENAVVTLVQGLLGRITTVESELKELKNQLKKDSRNSSKPPSGDGFKKRTKSLRKQSGRPSGGQKGHPGSTLEWCEQVDEVVVHAVNECHHCGHSLAAEAVVDCDFRQVHELPRLQLQVIEHQAEIKCCPQCASLSRGTFPADVSRPVQYGSGLKGLLVYLMDAQLLPSERTCEVLSEKCFVGTDTDTLACCWLARLCLRPLVVNHRLVHTLFEMAQR
ncbi:MAG: DUF6444 domain-containing protein, partial [Phormidesmis sp.]